MRIAWIGKKSPFCGNVTYSREITNALLDRGHEVSFLHFAQEESEPDNWPKFQEVSLPFIYKSQVYTIPTFKATKVLTESLRKIKPDIVHASLTLSPLDFILPEICEQLNLPLIATFHTPFAGKGAKLILNATFGLSAIRTFLSELRSRDCIFPNSTRVIRADGCAGRKCCSHP